MTESPPPLRFDPAFEIVAEDEEAVQHGLTETMLAIQRRFYEDGGYAHRAVHGKAQGLYAQPALYDATVRFSTMPGDVLGDTVATLRVSSPTWRRRTSVPPQRHEDRRARRRT